MSGIKLISHNKKARYDYFLEDSYEAGLVLQGTEVKSLRAGKCTMGEAYCTVDERGEVWVHQLKIAPYEFGTYANHDEDRKRKLLLNEAEIKQIIKTLATKGLTLVPTKVYFKGARVKIEIYTAKGKKNYDKREASAKKDVERKIQQGKYE
jgi:SsrA-binding protein